MVRVLLAIRSWLFKNKIQAFRLVVSFPEVGCPVVGFPVVLPVPGFLVVSGLVEGFAVDVSLVQLLFLKSCV